jgi:hypothetical protein
MRCMRKEESSCVRSLTDCGDARIDCACASLNCVGRSARCIRSGGHSSVRSNKSGGRNSTAHRANPTAVAPPRDPAFQLSERKRERHARCHARATRKKISGVRCRVIATRRRRYQHGSPGDQRGEGAEGTEPPPLDAVQVRGAGGRRTRSRRRANTSERRSNPAGAAISTAAGWPRSPISHATCAGRRHRPG